MIYKVTLTDTKMLGLQCSKQQTTLYPIMPCGNLVQDRQVYVVVVNGTYFTIFSTLWLAICKLQSKHYTLLM